MKTLAVKNNVAAGLAIGLLLAGAGIWYGITRSSAEAPAEARQDAGTLTEAQIRQLGIRLEAVASESAVPIGTVPAVVSLPPDARVAVSSAFSGTVLRVLVIQGQQVRRGEALAIVSAAETVQFGAELARSEADLAFARSNASRLDQLAREGIIAGARADEARASLARVEATIRENRRLLSLGGAGGDGEATLRAPIDGRVANVAIEAGGSVNPGSTSPFIIENTSKLSLDLQLPERLSARVRPGMTIEVESNDGMEPASGRVLSVASSLDPATRSVAAKASVDTGSALVPGKGVTVVIRGAGDPAQAGLSIPSAAVTRIEDRDFVFVRNARGFARREVTVVAEAGGRTFLSGGVRPGERVAVSGIAELKSMMAEQ